MNSLLVQLDIYRRTAISDKSAAENELQVSKCGEFYYSARFCGEPLHMSPPLDVRDNRQAMKLAQCRVLAAAVKYVTVT